MTSEAYNDVATSYTIKHGEPLVAGPEWVGEIYAIVEAAVQCDPALPLEQDLAPIVAARTADTIHVLTYGTERGR